jgi:hypothetical protein
VSFRPRLVESIAPDAHQAFAMCGSFSKSLGAWAGALLIAAGLVVLFFVNPADCPLYPQCWFHTVTGWLCPGCGSLRALHALLHGRVIQALQANALLVLALLVFAGFFLSHKPRGLNPALIMNDLTRQLRPVHGWWVIGLLLGFGLLRNLPMTPFCWLRP